MGTSETEIVAGIRSVVQNILPETEATHFWRHAAHEMSHLDSIQRLELVAGIENYFEVVLNPEDEDHFSSLEEVVQMLARKLREKAIQATERT